MTETAVPRVFVSHASEDKERFVLPFATALRSAGIEAWVDRWEIGPGDSLVARIFDEGLAGADAFIVVLSLTSVTKPWVQEELDSAVVRRIQSGREKRLIPILLDEGVDVPEPLKHLLWLSVPTDGIEAVTRQVVAAIHGQSVRPPVGPKPHYLTTPLVWTDDPQDETVFNLIVDELRAHDSPGWMLFSNGVQARAEELGIPPEGFRESMHALEASGRIKAEMMAGGTRWILRPLSDATWLSLEERRGVDLPGARRRLLAEIVNSGTTSFAPEDYEVGWRALGALLRELQAQGLLNVYSFAGDAKYSISGVSPLARRALRELER